MGDRNFTYSKLLRNCPCLLVVPRLDKNLVEDLRAFAAVGAVGSAGGGDGVPVVGETGVLVFHSQKAHHLLVVKVLVVSFAMGLFYVLFLHIGKKRISQFQKRFLQKNAFLIGNFVINAYSII